MKKFNFIKLSSLDFNLKSITDDTGRVYTTPDGSKYKSVTTVLSNLNKKAIMEWRNRVGEEKANQISKTASNRGTRLHGLCEQYLTNEITEFKYNTLMPDLKTMFNKIKHHLDEHIGNIYGIEQALYSKELKIAGRCDCIAEWDNVLSIIDFKTSSKEKKEDYILNYFLQCTAYALMFKEITNIEINKIVIVISVENGDSQIFIKDIAEYVDTLKNFVKMYT